MEKMASNHYHWSSERVIQKKSSGVYGVDAVDLLVTKVDALAQRFGRMNTSSSGSSLGMMYEVGPYLKYVAFKGTLLVSVTLLSREWSMPMLCKISTHAPHRTTPTQTHTTPIGEIIQISSYHPMPLNLSP